MMKRWFFTMGDRNVLMRAQFEADDGTVGDAHDVVEPGEMFLGFSYALEPSKSTSVCPFAHRRADGQGVHRKRAGDVDRLISVLEAARARCGTGLVRPPI